MAQEQPPGGEARAAARLDAFVDAAFAFAVTLLLIAGTPPANLDELVASLGRLPAFLASFALVLAFWLAHRDYSRCAARRGRWSTILSLALVFMVLVYVFPLRLLTESALHFLSGRRLPGQGLLDSFDDLRLLYVVYGLGFTVLAGILALLFRSVRGEGAASPAMAQAAREWAWTWVIIAASGLLSAAVAQWGPLVSAPWLPGVVYMLIPASLPLLFRLIRPRPAEDPAPASEAAA